MGRGQGAQRPLALTALPSPCDPHWLAALTTLEAGGVHAPGQPMCAVPVPNGAPRFIRITSQISDETTTPHLFEYYATPQLFLAALVLEIRRIHSQQHRWLEYYAASYTFRSILSLKSVALDYTPPTFKTPNFEQRAARVKALVQLNQTSSVNIEEEERFLVKSQGPAVLSLFGCPTFANINEWGLYAATNEGAITDIYDLDVSDQPVPIRFAIAYTGPDGVTYEVSEPA